MSLGALKRQKLALRFRQLDTGNRGELNAQQATSLLVAEAPPGAVVEAADIEEVVTNLGGSVTLEELSQIYATWVSLRQRSERGPPPVLEAATSPQGPAAAASAAMVAPEPELERAQRNKTSPPRPRSYAGSTSQTPPPPPDSPTAVTGFSDSAQASPSQLVMPPALPEITRASTGSMETRRNRQWTLSSGGVSPTVRSSSQRRGGCCTAKPSAPASRTAGTQQQAAQAQAQDQASPPDMNHATHLPATLVVPPLPASVTGASTNTVAGSQSLEGVDSAREEAKLSRSALEPGTSSQAGPPQPPVVTYSRPKQATKSKSFVRGLFSRDDGEKDLDSEAAEAAALEDAEAARGYAEEMALVAAAAQASAIEAARAAAIVHATAESKRVAAKLLEEAKAAAAAEVTRAQRRAAEMIAVAEAVGAQVTTIA
eukprot:COSAG01_NODE_309_length_19142_cov_22.748149_2_plen_428_part_00